MKKIFGKSSLLVALCSVQILLAQIQPQDSTKIAPQYMATELAQNPVIDGEVLNDPIWQNVSSIENLIQLRPNYGQPVSEKTVIRIAYTSSIFYVSVICYDKDAQNIVVSDSRRDADLNDEDSFLFIIDARMYKSI